MDMYIESHVGRVLHHQTNYSHYHRYSWVMPCSGMECHVPVAVVVIACLAAVMIMYLVGFFLYKRWKFQKALRTGEVPATMLIAGRWAMSTSQEEPHKFTFRILKVDMDDEMAIDECPICLKVKTELRDCIVFPKCKHGTCENCFRRMVSRQRLHTACPLCREFLSEGEGDRGAKELLPQSQAVLSSRAAPREDEEREERRRRRRERQQREEEEEPANEEGPTPDGVRMNDVEEGNTGN